MTTAIDRQIGGSHYKAMKIQPLELGYANQYDAPIYSAIKYVSRHMNKDGRQGLEKAIHCVEFALEMVNKHGYRECRDTIPIWDYIVSNKFSGPEAAILTDLHQFALRRPVFPETAASLITQKISALIKSEYGE